MDAPINGDDIEALRDAAQHLADCVDQLLGWLHDPPTNALDKTGYTGSIARTHEALEALVGPED